ncbi:MAG: YtxH domain-containing protein [Anaerolineae bacterium]|jgi:gas vesicle protein|nr:YtxH domain-containing protein [Anaerolineae bacterium]
MKKVWSFLTGLLVGAWLTGVTVLLFTPLSGKDLREKIKQESNQLMQDVKSASEMRQKELLEELENLRQGKNIKLDSVE